MIEQPTLHASGVTIRSKRPSRSPLRRFAAVAMCVLLPMQAALVMTEPLRAAAHFHEVAPAAATGEREDRHPHPVPYHDDHQEPRDARAHAHAHAETARHHHAPDHEGVIYVTEAPHEAADAAATLKRRSANFEPLPPSTFRATMFVRPDRLESALVAAFRSHRSTPPIRPPR